MKHLKFMAALLALAFTFTGTALAVDIDDSGTKKGTAKTLDFGDGLTVSKSGGVHTVSVSNDEPVSGDLTFRDTLLAIGRVGASTQVESSSTNLAPTSLPYSVILKNVGGDGGLDETGVGTELPDGEIGQVLQIIITGLQTNGSWIVTPNRATGFRNITFDTRGDTATLFYMNDTIGWVVMANGGAVITPVNFDTGI